MPVKASSTYENIASVLGFVGAAALVAAFYPTLNPEAYWRESVPLTRYIFGTLSSLFILSLAWHFNCKGMSRKLFSLEPRDKALLLGFGLFLLPLVSLVAAVLWMHVTEESPDGQQRRFVLDDACPTL